MLEGQLCENCNGAICAFCPFNKIVNNGTQEETALEEGPA